MYSDDALTLTETETDSETNKPMGCIELCGGVHTAPRQTPIQIPIEFSTILLVSVSANAPKIE